MHTYPARCIEDERIRVKMGEQNKIKTPPNCQICGMRKSINHHYHTIICLPQSGDDMSGGQPQQAFFNFYLLLPRCTNGADAGRVLTQTLALILLRCHNPCRASWFPPIQAPVQAVASLRRQLRSSLAVPFMVLCLSGRSALSTV